MIFVNVGETAPMFDVYAADLMARWRELTSRSIGGADCHFLCG